MLNLLPDCAILRVQSWDLRASIPVTLEDALNLAWPRSVGALATGRVKVACLGPADWLVLSADSDDAQLLLMFESAFEGTAFRATKVSSSLTRIQIDGPQVRALLTKACGLDLHPGVFAVGRCARTRFAGMPVIVRCSEADVFELIVSLSYREYLLAWLSDAALEF